MKTNRSLFALHPRSLRAAAGGAGLALLAGLSGVVEALPYPGRTPANKLTASDAEDFDVFGRAVAISGNVAVIGAEEENARGAAYVFDAVTGAELLKLTASDGQEADFYGSAVAISGKLAVIGAFDAGDGGSNRGVAYVYDLNTGEELRTLISTDAEDGDRFGRAIAISGNLAVIGAPEEESGGNDRGAAYLFDLRTGQQLRKLTALDPGDNDFFGSAVAISGNVAVIGANNEDGEGTNRGAAYVFDLSTEAEPRKLTATDGENNDFFGGAVAISGSLALIGAPEKGGGGVDRGAAYVYDLNTGTELRKLTASDAANGDFFGNAVAISGSLAVIGARESDGTGLHQGAAYVYDLNTGAQLRKLIADDAADNDFFGFSVAISGKLVVVGADGEDGAGSARGAAYVFEIPIHQPDNRIGTAAFSSLGDNLYNSSAAGQTLALTSRNLAQVNGFLTVTNDGDTGDNYTVSANPGNGNFAVRYLRRSGLVESDITAAMIAGTHLERNVVAAEPGRVIRAEITPSPRLKRRVKGRLRITRTTFLTRMTSVSGVQSFKRDTAAISVRTQ